MKRKENVKAEDTKDIVIFGQLGKGSRAKRPQIAKGRANTKQKRVCDMSDVDLSIQINKISDSLTDLLERSERTGERSRARIHLLALAMQLADSGMLSTLNAYAVWGHERLARTT